jgi:hypothetical protein
LPDTDPIRERRRQFCRGDADAVQPGRIDGNE